MLTEACTWHSRDLRSNLSYNQDQYNYCTNKIKISVADYRGADKSLTRPGTKPVRKHTRDARDFNNIETRAVIKFPPPPATRQGAEGNPRHSDKNINFFLPGRAKDLSVPLYIPRDVIQRLFQGDFYFKIAICFHGTRLNKISFTPICKVRPFLHRFFYVTRNRWKALCTNRLLRIWMK